jgi:hypothetical protein
VFFPFKWGWGGGGAGENVAKQFCGQAPWQGAKQAVNEENVVTNAAVSDSNLVRYVTYYSSTWVTSLTSDQVLLSLVLAIDQDMGVSTCVCAAWMHAWYRSTPRSAANTSLPEFGSLSSAGGFAESFLSGTRQSRLCRAPHSVNLGARQRALYRVLNTRHRTALGKDKFAECLTLGKVGSRQRAVSGRPKADGRQSLPRANSWHSAKRILWRVPHSRHSAKEALPSVISRHSAKYIFIFFILCPKNFVVCSYTM